MPNPMLPSRTSMGAGQRAGLCRGGRRTAPTTHSGTVPNLATETLPPPVKPSAKLQTLSTQPAANGRLVAAAYVLAGNSQRLERGTAFRRFAGNAGTALAWSCKVPFVRRTPPEPTKSTSRPPSCFDETLTPAEAIGCRSNTHRRAQRQVDPDGRRPADLGTPVPVGGDRHAEDTPPERAAETRCLRAMSDTGRPPSTHQPIATGPTQGLKATARCNFLLREPKCCQAARCCRATRSSASSAAAAWASSTRPGRSASTASSPSR